MPSVVSVLYTKRLGRILKAHRQLHGITRKAVQKDLLKRLVKHKREPSWDDFRALIDPDKSGGVNKLEDHGLAHEIISLPDVQLLANAYDIPELMLDPARSEPVEKLISVYSPQDFVQLKQEDVSFYGDGTQYYVPKTQIYGTVYTSQKNVQNVENMHHVGVTKKKKDFGHKLEFKNGVVSLRDASFLWRQFNKPLNRARKPFRTHPRAKFRYVCSSVRGLIEAGFERKNLYLSGFDCCDSSMGATVVASSSRGALMLVLL